MIFVDLAAVLFKKLENYRKVTGTDFVRKWLVMHSTASEAMAADGDVHKWNISRIRLDQIRDIQSIMFYFEYFIIHEIKNVFS